MGLSELGLERGNIVILNFYLRKHPPKGTMRTVEKHNLANVRALLKKRGVPNASRLDYHAAIQMLAKRIAAEGERR